MLEKYVCTSMYEKAKSNHVFTYILGEDKVGLEVPVSILSLWDPVGEGPVGLVPVDAHVAGRIVDQIVNIIPQLSGASSAGCVGKGLVLLIIGNWYV